MKNLIAILLTPMLIACSQQPPASAVGNIIEQKQDPYYECIDCSPEEEKVVALLQEKNIVDKNAIATILGNIKQESKFIANICEGGARVSYENCLTGGYGIIQWTSVNRYVNLGKFAEKFACDPSTFDCQLHYMVNEYTFVRQLPYFQGSGLAIADYMRPAYRWLGWGIKGNREVYAWDYLNKLQLTS